jgi:uncharacterized protein (TIGR02145 family)
MIGNLTGLQHFSSSGGVIRRTSDTLFVGSNPPGQRSLTKYKYLTKLHYKDKNYRRNKLKQIIKALFLFDLVLLIFSFGIKKSISQVTDIDGKTYKTIIIGTQEWMTENLNVEHYRNGDPIPQVKDADEWAQLTSGAWCYYENKSENGTTYGKLYNWYAVNDPRGLAPKGWHIPDDSEWTILSDNLGGDSAAGGKLKATTLWISPNTGATNESGFTAYPGGSREGNRRSGRGTFGALGRSCCFWTSSEKKSGESLYLFLLEFNSVIYRSYEWRDYGFSVRCVKD